MGGAVSGTQATEVLYDVCGNIRYKSDVGTYWYDAARPNRMTNVTLETASGASVAFTGTRALSYAFDDAQSGAQSVNGTTFGNGNLMYTVSQDTVHNLHTYRGEAYTSFNMPASFTYANYVNGAAATADRTLSFVYGPEHQRIKQRVDLSSNAPTSYSAGTTWYLNGLDGQSLAYEKEVKDSGLTEHKHYVSAGSVVFAVFVSRTGTLGGQAAEAVRYFHHDHLGSLAAISDDSGQVIERLAYDPWGKRRNTDGTQDVLDSIVGWNTERGYTMHEHLDEMGIIHMNGRVYDPLAGRFMSADPFIQAPTNLQSHNRYAYVLNNPLSLTDPSGYSWKSVLRTAVAIVAAVYLGPASTTALFSGGAGASAAAVGLANSVVAGFAAGAIQSGTLKGGVQGAVSGALFFGVGETLKGFPAGGFEKVAGHAAAGCVSAAASGGKCGAGAVSAGFAEAANPIVGVSGDLARDVTARAVVGGVGSALAGGKFENGAVTGAFGYLFNHCAHDGNCTSKIEQVLWDWMPGYKVGTCISAGGCTAGEWAAAVGETALSIAGSGGGAAVPRWVAAQEIGVTRLTPHIDAVATGGFEAAQRAFNILTVPGSLAGKETARGVVTTGTLRSGGTASLREFSTSLPSRPTVQLNAPNSVPIKVRYD